MNPKPLLLALTLCLPGVLFADTPAGGPLKVHSIFSSNMVLQRDKPILVWGWGKPGDKVISDVKKPCP